MNISEILTKYETDKNTNTHDGHCYGPIYDEIFSQFKQNDPISILEIGVNNGGSLMAWRQYFPNALICGIDITDYRFPKYKENYFSFILSDIKNPNLKNHDMIKNKKFDIMIDDGSHLINDVTYFVKNYLDHLNDNGYMIIEDVSSPEEWFKTITNIVQGDYSVIMKDLRKINGRFDDCLIIIKKQSKV